MRENIQRLHGALNEWLIRNDLHSDSRFYSPEEWRLRDEDVHNNASLILIFEGNLHTFINHTGDIFEIDDFDAIGSGFELARGYISQSEIEDKKDVITKAVRASISSDKSEFLRLR